MQKPDESEPFGTATPAAARGYLRNQLDGWDGPQVVEDAALLVSELVTNAILHGHANPATVSLAKTDHVLRVEVADPTDQWPPSSSLKTDLSVPGGHGLGIVDVIADRWGIVSNDHGKTVWFELHAQPRVLSTTDTDRRAIVT